MPEARRRNRALKFTRRRSDPLGEKYCDCSQAAPRRATLRQQVVAFSAIQLVLTVAGVSRAEVETPPRLGGGVLRQMVKTPHGAAGALRYE
jgi:hypothetical protein